MFDFGSFRIGKTESDQIGGIIDILFQGRELLTLSLEALQFLHGASGTLGIVPKTRLLAFQSEFGDAPVFRGKVKDIPANAGVSGEERSVSQGVIP